MDSPAFIRFQSRYPNSAGAHVGVFGLVNVLGRHGMLTPDEETFRRSANRWYDAAYPDPMTVDPTVYDVATAAAWFRSCATALLERVDGYLQILDAHRVHWERLEADHIGEIRYADAFQAVAVPARPHR